MSNLCKMPLPTEAWLGLQHTRNSLAIASRLKRMKSKQSIRFCPEVYQSQKSIERSAGLLGVSDVGLSWIFLASDDYLAILDCEKIKPCISKYEVNDFGVNWSK